MPDKQLLHFVFGGRVSDPQTHDFEDLDDLDFVGMYPDYAEAKKAWRGISQSKVDDACYKYVIVHIHRLMDPDEDEAEHQH